jgi:hypothetical protein
MVCELRLCLPTPGNVEMEGCPRADRQRGQGSTEESEGLSMV